MYKQSIYIFLSLFIMSGIRASTPIVDGILKYRIESSDGREQAVCCGFADNSHTLEPKPLVIPETIHYEGNVIPVVSIADSAFRSTSITGCTIPGSVESIGAYAFDYCRSMRYVRLDNSLRQIGEAAFSNCHRLESFIIPSGVKDIAKRAFDRCLSLRSLVIPEGVETIGENAFRCCAITSIRIPSTVRRIGLEGRNCDVFFGCWELDKIKVDRKNRVFDSRHGCNAIIETATNSLISGSNKTAIPYGISEIRAGAFCYRSRMESVHIPASVSNIEAGAFGYCPGLERISVSRRNRLYDSRDNCNAIIYTGMGTGRLHTACQNTRIPDDISSIGRYAYLGQTNLSAMVIPENISFIEDKAFLDCSDLRFIALPDSMSHIGYKTFSNCSALRMIIIPDGVKELNEDMFEGCTSLEYVILPETIEKIDNTAFTGCSSLNMIQVPGSGLERFKAILPKSLSPDILIPDNR